MARAQNDVYMVCPDGENNNDNTLEMLGNGGLTRAELQRNAKNILTFAMNTRAMDRLIGCEDPVEIINRPDDENEQLGDNVEVFAADREVIIPLDKVSADRGTSYVFVLDLKRFGDYEVTITASSDSGELAQIPVTMFVLGIACGNFTWNGTGGEYVPISRSTQMYSRYTTVRLYFAQSGLKLKDITFKLTREGKTFADV